MIKPIMNWEFADSENVDGIVWFDRLDNRFQIEVTRSEPYNGVLRVFDHNNDDTLVYEDNVGLMFDAVFGPDIEDVQDWRDLVTNFVDAELYERERHE